MGGEITMGRGLHDERGFSLLVAEGGNITNPNSVRSQALLESCLELVGGS